MRVKVTASAMIDEIWDAPGAATSEEAMDMIWEGEAEFVEQSLPYNEENRTLVEVVE